MFSAELKKQAGDWFLCLLSWIYYSTFCLWALANEGPSSPPRQRPHLLPPPSPLPNHGSAFPGHLAIRPPICGRTRSLVALHQSSHLLLSELKEELYRLWIA